MIQLNLLPNVKVEFIRTQRLKRLVLMISGLTAVVTLGIFIVLLVVVDVIQKADLNNVTKQVKQGSSQLENTANLNQILTVQNQLETLPKLHNQKPVSSRLFGYIQQLTPVTVGISSLKVDFGLNQVTIGGIASSLNAVNTYVDTLKFTTYTTTGQSTSSTKAFSNVVLGSFGRNAQGASYSIVAAFNPIIFNAADNVKLIVPSEISTRSEIDQPTNLFQKAATPTSTQTGQ